MTESETLKYFKDANRTNDMVCVLPKSDIGKCVIQALEKQMPKKPMISYDERVKEYWCRCGVCCFGLGWKRAINHKYKYCLNCGQAIDWS